MNKDKILCVLCNQTIAFRPIQNETHFFCCHGCQVVHTILLSKNQLENFVENPLFQQAVKSGLISNPHLLEQIKERDSLKTELEKFYFEVTDMWCPSCASVIRLILLQNPGVIDCQVDYATDLAYVTFSPRHLSKDAIFEKVRSLGYTPTAFENADRPAVSRSLYLRFIVAAFCALNVMMFTYPLYATYFDYDPLDYGLVFAWLSCAMSLPVLLYSAWPIARRSFNSLHIGVLGMETLVIFGVTASFALSIYELLQGRTRVYFDSMTVIVAFVLLGKIIESKAKFSTKQALLRLSRSLPKRGRKQFPDGTQKFVLIKELLKNDYVSVFAGEKIVLDGVVVEGEGCVDESLMTGESLPIMKATGSLVLGGTILQQGTLIFKVTATSEESMLHRIVGMVEQNLEHKSTYVRTIDPIIQYFVPIVLLIALGTGVYTAYIDSFEEGFLRGLSVILISCPCAIGIAAPLAESYLMHGLAALGVLVRNRGCLTYLGKETIYVFDKTGTITEGAFEVLNGMQNLSSAEIRILKGMTIQSNHLIAVAIARSIYCEKTVPESIVEVIGKGIKAEHRSQSYYLGSRSFMEEHGITIVQQDTINTSVYFAKKNELLTVLVLGDRVREESCDVVTQLYPQKTVMLSGDSQGPVQEVAKTCGFAAFLFNQTPSLKRSYIESLKQEGSIVCMIGDGMNDAPSLASAHIGVSVASATDISVQSSDILLTTHKLSVLPKMRELARRGRKILLQNIFWAFFYNIIGIALAVCGLLSPIFSTFAMMASSLIVLFNARRL